MVEVVKGDAGATTELLKSSLDRLAQSGILVVDHSPEPRAWDCINGDASELRRRQTDTSNDSSTTATTSKAATDASAAENSSLSPAASTTSSGSLSVSTQESTTANLPQPFDSGSIGDITESCSDFIYGFLNNSTFQACLPFSLLLQNSNSFFEIEKSAFKVTQTLDTTCGADSNVCNTLMDALAANITQSNNCASDLTNESQLVQEAELGLKAYSVLYSASCLRNPQTSAYCFADAITNASSPTDAYIYYLPLNISLQGGSQPTCNSCLKSSMAVFSAATSDRDSAIANTYVTAAQQINAQCGPDFVGSTLATAVKSNGASTSYGFSFSTTGILALALLVGSWLLR
ncbi:hypothetical protein BJ878DRAFT_422040 [Calycina marina]|uniref:DUF7729 domain-containing protein n=1 Tax=Calycina marina TaxID=1763456 RepID=A0A9P8CEJ0_9HELO|nr:hypothetical protein BJ878DRAFT_422040 [Calycina marina]